MTGGPRLEFRARLREQLMETPREEDLPERQTFPARPRPRTGLFSRLLSMTLAGSMVMAGILTYESMPGDTFYPLKRAAENTLFHLSTDDAERADRSFDYAETRAREVEELLGSIQGKNRLVGETLQEMEETTRSAVTSLTRVRRRDPKSSGELKRFVQKQHDQIEGMLPKMDVEDQKKANGYLSYIDGLAPPD
jgi:hypothetical protein